MPEDSCVLPFCASSAEKCYIRYKRCQNLHVQEKAVEEVYLFEFFDFENAGSSVGRNVGFSLPVEDRFANPKFEI